MGATRPRPVAVLGLLLVGLLIPGLPGAGPQAGAAQTPPDTIVVDSTRIRLQQRLDALDRGLARPDTTARVDSTAIGRFAESGPVVILPSDPFIDSLLQLPGFDATEYTGRRAIFETFPDGTKLRLLGSAAVGDSLADGVEPERAQVVMAGAAVRADSAIDYDERTGLGAAYGSPRSSQEGQDPLDSETLVFDLETARASALGAETVYRMSGSEWRIFGNIPYYSDGTFFGHDLLFTTCTDEETHYHFEAERMKVTQGEVMVARNVTLNFASVPVLWLPFIAQSTKSGRHSGLLTPRFSVNDIVRTSGNHRRRIQNIGFYWAANAYMDATLAFEWFSGEYKSLTGGVDYRWARQFLNGGLTYKQFWVAGGGRQLALRTRNTWEPDERTRVSLNGSFASDVGFVRRNTFDPVEVTRSIDSDGGINRTFDWGSASLALTRRQFLSDDRVESTLPKFSISPRSITLFRAPANDASFYNNAVLTMNGSIGRNISDRPTPTDTIFRFNQADLVKTNARYSTGLTLGGVTLGHSLTLDQNRYSDVPDSIFPEPGTGPRDLSQTEARWTVNLSYQLGLIGSTTLSPSVSLSSRLLQSDSIADAANGFISAPTTTSFGLDLRSDLYGFLPGVGPFEAIRHKVTPSIGYSYAPMTTPDEIQARVFGARETRKRSQLSFGINQTFEAKPRGDVAAADTIGQEGPGDVAVLDALAAQQAGDSLQALVGLDAPATRGSTQRGGSGSPLDDETLQRPPEGARPLTLFALNTSVINYDLVEADSTGRFIDGFTTTRMTNAIRSDYLRGITIQLEHELFDTDPDTEERIFSLHLARVNASFSVNGNSSFLRWLGLGGGDGGGAPSGAEAEPEVQEGETGAGSFESIIPEAGANLGLASGRPGALGATGTWNLGLSYNRISPRNQPIGTSETMGINMSLSPTENWSATWSTSYDITNGQFTDHNVGLVRQLHRWQAEFGFLQTATGNWSFTFQVALQDNRDLQFDYSQRDLDGSVIAR